MKQNVKFRSKHYVVIEILHRYHASSQINKTLFRLVKDLYTEPTEEREAGNLFNFIMALPPTFGTSQAPVKRKTKSASTTVSRN